MSRRLLQTLKLRGVVLPGCLAEMNKLLFPRLVRIPPRTMHRHSRCRAGSQIVFGPVKEWTMAIHGAFHIWSSGSRLLRSSGSSGHSGLRPTRQYFKNLRWYTTVDTANPLTTSQVTWAELVLDFRLATGCRIWNENQDPTNLGQQALACKMATQTIANIIAKVGKQEVAPLFAGTIVRTAPTLRSMGFGKALGLTMRPQLLQPFTVGSILASWMAKQRLPVDNANRPVGCLAGLTSTLRHDWDLAAWPIDTAPPNLFEK